MGTIQVQLFTTVDNAVGAPMWTMDYPFTDEMGAAIGQLTTGSATAILLGRTTWEESGPAWSGRDMADDPGAPFFNETAKYVVSGSRTEVDGWNNSTLLGAYDADAIRRFKDGVDGGIYVFGSTTLVRALLDDGLVDELHLFVYPVALGEGPTLFGSGTPKRALTLKSAQSFTNGVVHLAYAPDPATPAA